MVALSCVPTRKVVDLKKKDFIIQKKKKMKFAKWLLCFGTPLLNKIDVRLMPIRTSPVTQFNLDVNTTINHWTPFEPIRSRLSLRFQSPLVHRIRDFYIIHQGTKWAPSGHQSIHSFLVHFLVEEDPFLPSLDGQNLGCVTCSLLNETISSKPLLV